MKGRECKIAGRNRNELLQHWNCMVLIHQNNRRQNNLACEVANCIKHVG